MFERDSKVVAHARHDLLAEQEAMNLRLQQHTLQMQFQIAPAEKAFREAISWATGVISDDYSTELKNALDAQKCMHRENDVRHIQRSWDCTNTHGKMQINFNYCVTTRW